MNKPTIRQTLAAAIVGLLLVTGARAADVAGSGPAKKVNAPKDKVAEAVSWLEAEAGRVIRASRRKMKDGSAAFPPQVGTGYEAFWLRDYEYTLEGSIASYSDKELTDACRLFVRSMNSRGAGVDCVKFDGTPVYKPGNGSMGENPVADGSQFTVGVAFHTYRKTKDAKLLGEILDPLVKTMGAARATPKRGWCALIPRGPGIAAPTASRTPSANRATSCSARCCTYKLVANCRIYCSPGHPLAGHGRLSRASGRKKQVASPRAFAGSSGTRMRGCSARQPSSAANTTSGGRPLPFFCMSRIRPNHRPSRVTSSRTTIESYGTARSGICRAESTGSRGVRAINIRMAGIGPLLSGGLSTPWTLPILCLLTGPSWTWRAISRSTALASGSSASGGNCRTTWSAPLCPWMESEPCSSADRKRNTLEIELRGLKT